MLQKAKLQHYLSSMSRRGFPPHFVLARSGLTQEVLREDRLTIDLAQTQIIIRNMLELTSNEALGLELGLEITPSEMGIVGQGMIAAPTFRHAIRLWDSYASRLFGSLIDIDISDEQELWRMHITAKLPPGLCYQFCLEEYLAITANLGRQLIGKPPVYGSLDIAYPAPQHAGKYQQLFKCAVNFDAPGNCITVLTPQLDDFIETRDEYLYPIYQHYCKRRAEEPVDVHSTAYRVHNYLLKNLGRNPTIEAMAKEERCSASTLRRQLKNEGHTFRALHNRFRQDFAEEYLKSTTLSAKEVAYLLGYRDTKPFLRAFKLWTGKTVGEYKRSL